MGEDTSVLQISKSFLFKNLDFKSLFKKAAWDF